MGIRTRFGLWSFLELIQVSVILFLLALLASFIIGSVFTEIDKSLEKSTNAQHNCQNNNDYKAGVFFVTLFQLIIIAAAYYGITKLMKLIPSVSATLKKNFPGHRTTEFALHIVLIVLLIELNPSIVHNLHRMGYFVDVSKYHRVECDDSH